MKHLEQEQLEKLLGIIGASPAVQIGHFADSGVVLTKTLSALCKEKEYLYQVNCTDAGYYENTSERFRNNEHVRVLNFPLARKVYLTQGREFNFLFVSCDIEETFRGEFLKRVYPIIRSSGNIILFVPNKDPEEQYLWTSLLEEHNYVATNVIDDMFEHYSIVISKKMHGWGNS